MTIHSLSSFNRFTDDGETWSEREKKGPTHSKILKTIDTLKISGTIDTNKYSATRKYVAYFLPHISIKSASSASSCSNKY